LSEKEQEKERVIGNYRITEWTARRLVVERKRRPLITVGVMWMASLPVLAFLAPWKGGVRLFMSAIVFLAVVAASLLTLAFTATRRELDINLEEGTFRMTRNYLIRPTQTLDIALQQIEKVRQRHRIWNAPGEVEKSEWVIDLVDEEGTSWVLVAEDEKEPVGELARLLADVSGRPLEAES
jgi:hypothetical protein